jgi:hypothetical protein
MKPKTKDFGLFRFVLVFRTYIETTEAKRSVSKQTKTNRNNPKFSKKYQNMLFIKLLVFCLFRFNRNIESLCFGIHQNNRNKLFRNKPKQTETTLNFLKKDQNIPSFTLFRLLFYLFRFNQNTETLCFGLEPKQPKQTFCFV